MIGVIYLLTAAPLVAIVAMAKLATNYALYLWRIVVAKGKKKSFNILKQNSVLKVKRKSVPVGMEPA